MTEIQSDKSPTRILIVDDHAPVIRVLKLGLEEAEGRVRDRLAREVVGVRIRPAQEMHVQAVEGLAVAAVAAAVIMVAVHFSLPVRVNQAAASLPLAAVIGEGNTTAEPIPPNPGTCVRPQIRSRWCTRPDDWRRGS